MSDDELSYKIFPCDVKECLKKMMSSGDDSLSSKCFGIFLFLLLILAGLFTFIAPCAFIYISFYATRDKVGLHSDELYGNFTMYNHGVTYDQEIDKLTYVNAPMVIVYNAFLIGIFFPVFFEQVKPTLYLFIFSILNTVVVVLDVLNIMVLSHLADTVVIMHLPVDDDMLTDFPAFRGFTYFHVVYCVYFYSVVYRFYKIFKMKQYYGDVDDAGTLPEYGSDLG